MILDPTGKRANLACLKCCIPNGIPTMVKQKMIPKDTSSMTITNPPSTSHTIFMKSDEPLLLNSISLPKGAAAIVANLKHCLPMGNPIIVIDHKTPSIIQVNQLMNPPRINQTIFPNNFKCASPFLGYYIIIVYEM